MNYKNQVGAITGGIIALVIVGLIVLAGLFTIGSYISAANYGAATEQSLLAKHGDLKNIRGNYTNKISEMAQVPQMYRGDLEKVISATFEGRYGADGSKATWQWIQEQNPALDPALYNRIQQTMEAGRNEFQRAQTEFLDIKRVYVTNLNFVWRGFWLKLAGYPKIDLDKLNIVLAQDTQQIFDSGIDAGVKLPAQEPAK